MNYPAMIHRAEALMRELKVPDMNVSLPVSQYGGGYQQLVEIAKALNKHARLLILDEPSSALTRSEIEVLLDIIRDLKTKGVACVYISHKLDEVAAVCDTISVIRDGKHIATTAMADMDIPQIITQMVGREMSNLYPTEPHDIGEVIFEARHITCYDVDNPQRKRVDDISFSLKRGEILGIAGLVGAGRTELVTALFGAYPGRHEGEVWLNGQLIDTRTPLKSIRAGLCLVPEDRKRQGIIPDLGVGQNITLAVLDSYSKLTRIDAEAELGSIDREISRLHLKTASPFLPITSTRSETPSTSASSEDTMMIDTPSAASAPINL
jgi:D-xylose transport system ATP-binding protein